MYFPSFSFGDVTAVVAAVVAIVAAAFSASQARQAKRANQLTAKAQTLRLRLEAEIESVDEHKGHIVLRVANPSLRDAYIDRIAIELQVGDMYGFGEIDGSFESVSDEFGIRRLPGILKAGHNMTYRFTESEPSLGCFVPFDFKLRKWRGLHRICVNANSEPFELTSGPWKDQIIAASCRGT